VNRLEFGSDARGASGCDCILNLSDSLIGALIGHEPGADFRDRAGWDHCFCALAGEAATDSMHLERRASPETFEQRVPGFAHQRDCLHFPVQVVLLMEGQTRPGGAFYITGRQDSVMEGRNADVAVAILKSTQNLGDCLNRIGRRASIDAGMEVLFRALHGEFAIDDAAEPDTDCRQLRREHFGITDDCGVGVQSRGFRRYVLFDVLAADFLFTFDQETDIDGQ
jgi:hypothetical protein